MNEEDKNRLKIACNRKLFILQFTCSKYAKTKGNTLKPYMSWTEEEKKIFHETENMMQKRILNHQKFTCKLCSKFTNRFNFTEYDDSCTSTTKMWCIDCELWWNERNGFEDYLEIMKSITNEQNIKEDNRFNNIMNSIEDELKDEHNNPTTIFYEEID